MEKMLSTIVCAWLFLKPATLWGQVEGFEESFTGQGVYQSVGTNYDGLDNVAWTIDGTGELTKDGYAFHLDGAPIPFPPQESIRRHVYGQGSFWQEIVLKDLILGDRDESHWGAGSEVTLWHNFAAGIQQSRVTIGLSDRDEVGAWQLVVGAFGENQREVALVPKAAEFSSMVLHYNQEESTVTGYYDFNLSDELPPIELSFPIRMELSPESETRFGAATVGFATSGTIHSWKLTPILALTGDFSGNGALDVGDIDILSAQARAATHDTRFDLNSNSVVDQSDVVVWVHDLKKTYYGDANLDGQFNSHDLTLVFQAGRYEDSIEGNSGWATGDWDADAEFKSSDLVVAFQDGGYEQGPRPAVNSVPEPSAFVMMGLAFLGVRRQGHRYGSAR